MSTGNIVNHNHLKKQKHITASQLFTNILYIIILEKSECGKKKTQQLLNVNSSARRKGEKSALYCLGIKKENVLCITITRNQ